MKMSPYPSGYLGSISTDCRHIHGLSPDKIPYWGLRCKKLLKHSCLFLMVRSQNLLVRFGSVTSGNQRNRGGNWFIPRFLSHCGQMQVAGKGQESRIALNSQPQAHRPSKMVMIQYAFG
jgi:hypothetical protein